MSFKTLTNQAMIALMLAIVLVMTPSVSITGQGRNSSTTPPNPVTTLTQTTLSAAVIANTDVITVASATGFTVGNRVAIVTANAVEAADIRTISGTTITLNRSNAGTGRYPHASGDVVFTQRGALFQNGPPKSACVSTTTGTGASAVTIATIGPTPWIDLAAGDIYYCVGGTTGQWVRTLRNGNAVGDTGSTHVFTYTAAGALFLVPGVHVINGTTLAMTIAPPTKDMDGMVLMILSLTASAQTLTYTAGFSQTTTSSDIATFGGAVNDGLVIVADAGVWHVISTRNVTIA